MLKKYRSMARVLMVLLLMTLVTGCQSVEVARDEVVVAFADEPGTLAPTAYSPATLTRIRNIYEGLVSFDQHMGIRPTLAVSWGNVDDYTVEFKLRPGVSFHSGDVFSARDVSASLEAASAKGSGVSALLSGIAEMKIVDDYTVQFISKRPDPLLVRKLTALMIVPAKLAGKREIEKRPVGTGPYKFVSWDKENQEINLIANDGYWGEQPFSKNLVYAAIDDKYLRTETLVTGRIDLLGSVPPELNEELGLDASGQRSITAEDYGVSDQIKVISRPGLETKFVMFNLGADSPFADRRVREAFALALDPLKIADFSKGLLEPASQLVTSDTVGYNPALTTRHQDLERMKELLKEANYDVKQSVTLDISSSLVNLAQAIQYEMTKAGILVDLNMIEPTELVAKIAKQESDLYFFGWNASLGDSYDLLAAVLHSPGMLDGVTYGQYNGSGYANERVDELIEKAFVTLSARKRIRYLQEAMSLAVVDDVVGIPLVQERQVYAFHQGTMGLDYTPRVDGLVLGADIKPSAKYTEYFRYASAFGYNNQLSSP